MSVKSSLQGLTQAFTSNFFVPLPYPQTTESLSKRTVIVTGSNTGLGFEASRHLLRLGVGKLIMGVRNMEKGETARQELVASTKVDASAVEVWHLDMSSHKSVVAFARKANGLPQLDAVLANAGIMTTQFNLCEGDESTLTVNVVSTFLLFFLLLPKLQESDWPGKFVIPNSSLHYMAPLKELVPRMDEVDSGIFARLNNPKGAIMSARYPLSKLLVLYVTRELADRLRARATTGKQAVIVNTPNPSYCKSGLQRETDGFGVRMAQAVFARTTEMGSRALVHGVLSGGESNGQFLHDCKVAPPSAHATTPKGLKAQKSFFDELMDRLEKISPGVTANL